MSPAPDSNNDEPPTFEELISLQEASRLSGLSAGHLRFLAGQGKIWARKLGRNWVTTKQAIEDYLAQDRRPGPKPKESQGS